ncbi:TIGR03619 family F420-dependent LLM class oxidoreductase [Enemella sp. A6]|uniref:TIGR03619 family F420-dependent LLM class oxidoreductase n=1 Tax=Enemella sp. A6 TaxID=3440152 RepID=UPI003EBBE87A
MKFSTSVAMVDPSYYVPLARAAEEAGFDVVLLADSIGYPRESDTSYPYNPDGTREFLENKPFLEPVVAMSAMAAATSTISFCPYVLKLPIRHPVIFAKQITSLAVLSNNRVQLGIGTSPWPDDYDLVELPWEARGKRFNECVKIIQGLTGGDYFEFHGEFYDFDAVKMNPVPTEPIPMLIGGNSEVLIKRAARIGDGWLPTGLGPDEMRTRIDQIHQLRAEFGREHLPFTIQGPGVRTVDDVHAAAELGATQVMGGFGRFNPYGTAQDTEPLADKIDRLKRFGDEVIGPYRAATG